MRTSTAFGLLAVGIGGVGVIWWRRRRRTGATVAATTASGLVQRIVGGREPRPDELVTLPKRGGGTEQLKRQGADAYTALVQAARAAGFQPPLFELDSGYRGDALQKRLWDRQVAQQRTAHPGWSDAQITAEARKWVAPPGYSNHRTGCTVDTYLGVPMGAKNDARIGATAAYQWLAANAARFGWAPYKREKWHWEHAACAMAGTHVCGRLGRGLSGPPPRPAAAMWLGNYCTSGGRRAPAIRARANRSWGVGPMQQVGR